MRSLDDLRLPSADEVVAREAVRLSVRCRLRQVGPARKAAQEPGATNPENRGGIVGTL